MLRFSIQNRKLFNLGINLKRIKKKLLNETIYKIISLK